MFRAFFDRNKESINGFFTIQDPTGNKIFNKISVRSGQQGYEETSWVVSKSPIPYGEHWLRTYSYNRGEKPGKFGIGEFFPIGTDTASGIIEKEDEPKIARIGIGLHSENTIPGSAGCIVIVQEHDFLTIAQWLHEFHNKDLENYKMRLTVL